MNTEQIADAARKRNAPRADRVAVLTVLGQIVADSVSDPKQRVKYDEVRPRDGVRHATASKTRRSAQDSYSEKLWQARSSTRPF